jgi:hypothetical protein
MQLSVEMFEPEIAQAVASYDRSVVCLERSAQDCREVLTSLITKAINAYEGRAPGLRHGIALDRYVTVILSQTDLDRPSCGIYFNLSSPYFRANLAEAGRNLERLAKVRE